MNDLRFAWDERKARRNVLKHDVTFEGAASAFFDEHARLIHDADHCGDEERYLLLGLSAKLRLLVVCHCYRQADQVIRIISARKAGKREVEQYGALL